MAETEARMPFETVMTASSRVFAIPELLENILLHLPERDLLLAQRVNKTFRDVTTASVHLQRKLFFTADLVSEDVPAFGLKRNTFTEIFRPKEGFYFTDYRLMSDRYLPLWRDWCYKNVESTMSLDEYVGDPRYPRYSSLKDIQIMLHVVQLDFKALKKADHPSASWKRMFFTQPALREMEISIIHFCHDTFFCSVTLEDISGLRMGQFIEIDWRDWEKNAAELTIITELRD